MRKLRKFTKFFIFEIGECRNMFRISTLFSCFILMVSCSTTTNTTPSWVFDVIAGNKLEISIGQDVYFRTSYKENNKSTETLCELATNQIKKNIEKAYPWVNVSDIPLKNPLKWYPLKDKNNICFVSYSVPKSYLETREFQRSYIGVMGKSQDTGILSLITKPVNDAVVYIDGTAVQTKNSNFDYGIQTGKHKLKIEHPYYETIEEDFDIKKGKTGRILGR